MQPIAINLMALLACVAVRFIVGGLWFSPLLFLRAWQAETGVNDAAMKPRMPLALASDLIGAILMAFVLAHATRYAGASTALIGAMVGALAWLGFVAVTAVARVTYEGSSLKLFAINGGYNLVTLVVMGAILGQWG
jgi:multisubunit Na+/H+ antiporter MnhF subunit